MDYWATIPHSDLKGCYWIWTAASWNREFSSLYEDVNLMCPTPKVVSGYWKQWEILTVVLLSSLFCSIIIFLCIAKHIVWHCIRQIMTKKCHPGVAFKKKRERNQKHSELCPSNWESGQNRRQEEHLRSLPRTGPLSFQASGRGPRLRGIKRPPIEVSREFFSYYTLCME